MSTRKSKLPDSANLPDGRSGKRTRPEAARIPRDSRKGTFHDRRVWLLLPVLMAATLAAYYPAWHGGMLWDDDRHVTRADLRTAEGLERIWLDLGATQQYYPLTHSAFWLQHKLWGDDTLGYHLVNILLHASSAFLVALILRRLGAPGACLAAVIFALHPVQVESVAWIAELKNTLSGALYLSAALVYLQFDTSRRKPLYAMATVLFTLALLSKTITATLPAALLVTFWWQRERLSWRRDALPLLPWFALGGAAGLLTVHVERTMIGAQGAEYQFTLVERALIAGRVFWFYLGKLAWPMDLTFIYPRWQVSQSAAWQYLFPLGMMALLVGLWLVRKTTRAPLAATLIFAGTIFPVMGFFNVYPFRYSFVADHFQYLASIAIFALFSSGLAVLVRRWDSARRPALLTVMLIFGTALALPTWRQSHQYTDGETLYRTTLSRNPACWMAHNNLGNVLQGTGRLEEALTHYREAIRLKTDYAEAYNNLGDALHRLGRREEAIISYQEAVRLKQDFAGAHYNLGNSYQEVGRLEEAATHYMEALKYEPDLAMAHGNLGAALEGLGRFDEAMEHLREAVRRKPGYAIAHYNLGNVLQRVGRYEEATSQYREALHFKPDYAEACNSLGDALQKMGRLDEAVAKHKEALQIRPDFAEAYNNLGNAYQGLGRFEEALAQYRQALRIKPDVAMIYFNLGNAYQGMGRSEDAVRQYQEALRLDPALSGARYNLGYALQRQGRHYEAAAQYEEILKKTPGSADAHNSLGIALAMLGRLNEAAARFREAVRLKPDYAEAQANLARTLKLLGKNDP